MTAPSSILPAAFGAAIVLASLILSFGAGQSRLYLRTLDWIVRGILALNCALFIALFIPAYSGIGQRDPGLSERLWGNYRLYGFDAQFVWVCASTVFIIVASIPFIVVGGVTETKDRHYHKTAILCLVWPAFFVVYFVYSLLNSF